MQHNTSRRFPPVLLALTLAASAAVAFGGTVAAGQRAASGAALPRTPDGHPDLQGIWNNSTQTPLQRPAALGTKQVYTDEELAKLRLRNHDVAPQDGDPGDLQPVLVGRGRAAQADLADRRSARRPHSRR